VTRRSVRVDQQFFSDLDAQLVVDGTVVLVGIEIDLG
jgi:hypothetical protein